ncbi:hypothetical protein RhiirB3_510216, partial [Rhizophagus irregularis]
MEPIDNFGIRRFRIEPIKDIGIRRFQIEPIKDIGIQRFQIEPIKDIGIRRFRIEPIKDFRIRRFFCFGLWRRRFFQFLEFGDNGFFGYWTLKTTGIGALYFGLVSVKPFH